MTCSVQYIFSTLAADPDYSDLVAMYVDEMPDRIEQIREAFDSTDRDRLIRLIHQLKGAAGSYGFATLTEEATLVEHMLLDGDNTNDAAAITQLLETCEKVRSGTGS
jgi:HPt (histidine-containing phosphotransfer) domain-containing protein